MTWVLAISVLLLGYAYGGYPASIWVLSRFYARPVQKGPYGGGVSVLIAAHNEADSLPAKLENLLLLAENEPIREIWIGLDGCTDGTEERIRERSKIFNIQYSISNVQVKQGESEGEVRSLKPEVRGPRSEVRSPTANQQPLVQILKFDQPRGKAAVLNDLMIQAQQPIFVMMDARQRVEPGAIGRLLENFADPQVGVVSGALVYESAAGGVQKGADSYWGYEKFIRQCESRFWAVPGATGALYAIRRELCQPIPENTLVDDVLIPMRAVLKGFRCLFEPSARVFDLPSVHFGQEGQRKRRTLAGIWQLAGIEPRIYSIFSNPIGFQWFSHKFLRLLTPFLLLITLSSLGLMAWSGSRVLQWLFLSGILIALISFLAFLGGKRTSYRALGLLGSFFGVNLALALAAWDAATGRMDARWKQ